METAEYHATAIAAAITDYINAKEVHHADCPAAIDKSYKNLIGTIKSALVAVLTDSLYI